jgi:hypothetical protein
MTEVRWKLTLVYVRYADSIADAEKEIDSTRHYIGEPDKVHIEYEEYEPEEETQD